LSSVLPVDIGAIKAIGVDKILDVPWPVANNTFDLLCREILDPYYACLASTSDHISDILLADTTFLEYLVQVAHYDLVKQFSKSNGKKIHSTEISHRLLYPDWKATGAYYNRVLKNRGKFRRARRIYRNIRYHPQSPKFGLPFLSSNCWSFGSIGSVWMQDEFLRESDKFYSYYDWDDTCWVTENILARGNNGLKVDRPILSTLYDLCSELERNLTRLKVQFDWNIIVESFSNRLGTLCQIYEAIMAEKKLPASVLVTAENDPRRKIILNALQRRGVAVTGMLHGDPIFGIYRMSDTIATSMSHVGKYLTPSAKTAVLYAELYGQTAMNSKKIVFEHFSTNYLNRVFASNREHNQVKLNKKNVMIIGFPMNVTRYPDDSGLFFYEKIQQEIRLAMVLRKCGQTVIYRPHPDRLQYVSDVVRPYVDRISLEPFNKAMCDVGTIAFTHPTTSTFGVALLTNKNIILLEDKRRDQWSKRGLELLRKRCHFIELNRDSLDQPEISQNEIQSIFVESIENERMLENTEFIDYYWGPFH